MKIWWYKDKKIGHIKQVSVLIDELKKDHNVSIREIDCGKSILIDLFRLFLSFFQNSSTDNYPDMLIGAGHDTYLKILSDKNRFKDKTKSVAILKPSILRSNFDLVCAPEHDFEKGRENNTFLFKGSLAKVSDHDADANIGLIALGGINNHYEFLSEDIIKQIEFIINLKNRQKWYIFNSRRTPNNLNVKLNKLANSSIEFIDCNNKNHLSLDNVLGKASIKVVTPDSVNLVFESLSSKSDTVLLHLHSKKENKITKLMSSLISTGDIGYIKKDRVLDNLQTYKLTPPHLHHQIYAEVEKVAFKISKLIEE